ncbi:low-density lipoprotein receptor class A domain-containing protein 2 [Mobula birostris]|uniref:low-density lipoprotein receptor class A domain-containing protein 2 n=1 Tax=Mobula birostris TaxID=1983395 RepID=UPI003B28D335
MGALSSTDGGADREGRRECFRDSRSRRASYPHARGLGFSSSSGPALRRQATENVTYSSKEHRARVTSMTAASRGVCAKGLASASGDPPQHPLWSWQKTNIITGNRLLNIEGIQVNLVDFCGQTIRADGIIVNSHQEAQKYYFVTVGTDCRFTMQAVSPKDKVHFQFRYFLVYSLLRESSILQPLTLPPHLQRNATGPLDTCNAGSYVQFYDGKDRTSSPIGSLLCGKNIPKPILSTGNYLTLRLVTRGQQPRVDFIGHFTSYRPECSGEAYFQCQNGNCIPMSLVCDSESIDNCGDGCDESAFLPDKCRDGTSILSAFNETSTSTMERSSPSPSINLSTLCQTPRRHHHLLSNNIPYLDSAAGENCVDSLITVM